MPVTVACCNCGGGIVDEPKTEEPKTEEPQTDSSSPSGSECIPTEESYDSPSATGTDTASTTCENAPGWNYHSWTCENYENNPSYCDGDVIYI